MMKPAVDIIQNAVAATTATDRIYSKVRSMMVLFTRTLHSAGNTVFKVEGSVDGTTYVALPLVSLAATTNSQTLTRVLSVSLSADGSGMYMIEEQYISMLKYFKFTSTRTTDGSATIKVAAEEDLD